MEVFNLIIGLGAHIGGSVQQINPQHYQFILFKRNDYYIFNVLNNLIVQLRRACSFFKELGARNAFFSFFHSSGDQLPSVYQVFFVSLVSLSTNNAYYNQMWSSGQLSNIVVQSKQLFYSLYYFDTFSSRHRLSTYSIFELFYTILFFSYRKRFQLRARSWTVVFNIIRKYWRFFYFFKYFSFKKDLPDTFIYVDSSDFNTPLNEAAICGIPSVSLSDTTCSLKNVSFLLSTNTQSYLLCVFYLTLFINSYILGIGRKCSKLFDFSSKLRNSIVRVGFYNQFL